MSYNKTLRDAIFPLFDRLLKTGSALNASRFAARDPLASRFGGV